MREAGHTAREEIGQGKITGVESGETNPGFEGSLGKTVSLQVWSRE